MPFFGCNPKVAEYFSMERDNPSEQKLELDKYIFGGTRSKKILPAQTRIWPFSRFTQKAGPYGLVMTFSSLRPFETCYSYAVASSSSRIFACTAQRMASIHCQHNPWQIGSKRHAAEGLTNVVDCGWSCFRKCIGNGGHSNLLKLLDPLVLIMPGGYRSKPWHPGKCQDSRCLVACVAGCSSTRAYGNS